MKKKITISIIIFITLTILYFLGINYKDLNNLKENNTQNKDNIPSKESGSIFMNKAMINIDNSIFEVSLYDNEATRKLYSNLPLELSMTDLNNNEKYVYLDFNVPTKSEKIKNINAGDIMLFGNDCLVLFYESFTTSYSYTKIGKIDNVNNLKDIVGKNNISVKIYLK